MSSNVTVENQRAITAVNETVIPGHATSDNSPGTIEAQAIGNLEPIKGSSLDEVKTALFEQAKSHGFAVTVRRRSDKDHISGEYRRYDMECTRSRYTPSQGQGIRQKTFFRTGCAWKGKIVYSKAKGEWVFTVMEHKHDHGAIGALERLPAARRHVQTQETRKALEDLLKQERLSAMDICDQMRRNFPDMVMTEQDVWNFKKKQRKNLFEGRTATQQFIHELQQDPDVEVVVKFRENERDGPIEGVFWAYKWSLAMWRDNNEVMSVDNTYKTNRFNLPLMQFNGVTGLHTTFNIGFALLKDEKTESFEWALGQLMSLGTREQVERPFVFISDKDDALRSAARNLYPVDVKLQLCVWHVMKNIVYHIRRRWNGTLANTSLADLRPVNDEGADETTRENQENNNVALRLLDERDRSARHGEGDRNITLQPISRLNHSDRTRKWENSADGLLLAWKATVYADTEGEFWNNWEAIKREFQNQQGVLIAIQTWSAKVDAN